MAQISDDDDDDLSSLRVAQYSDDNDDLRGRGLRDGAARQVVGGRLRLEGEGGLRKSSKRCKISPPQKNVLSFN